MEKKEAFVMVIPNLVSGENSVIEDATIRVLTGDNSYIEVSVSEHYKGSVSIRKFDPVQGQLKIIPDASNKVFVK